jgi:hypothetical protein
LEEKAELLTNERFAELKADYQMSGPDRSNPRYGYVARPA